MDQQTAGKPFSPNTMQDFLDIMLKQLDKRAANNSIFREKRKPARMLQMNLSNSQKVMFSVMIMLQNFKRVGLVEASGNLMEICSVFC